MSEEADRERRVRLTHWLRRYRRKDREAIEEWLRVTPPGVAARLVRDVIRRQEVRRRTREIITDVCLCLLGGVVMVALLTALIWVLSLDNDIMPPLPLAAILFFTPTIYMMAEQWQRGQKTRERAVRLLVYLGDPAAIRYLAPDWQFVPTSLAPTKGHRQLSETLAELARIATNADSDTGDCAVPLRSLLGRFADARPDRIGAADAEMLLAVIRFLAMNGTPDDRRVLQRVASLSPIGNERLVLLIEAARIALESPAPNPVTPTIAAEDTATTNPEPILVSQRRL